MPSSDSWFKKGHKPWSYEKTRPITITKYCEYCGKPFTYSRNPLWNNPFPKCCSKECRYKLTSKVQKGRISPLKVLEYEKRMKKAAERTVQRLVIRGLIEKKVCEICGNSNTEAHHYLGYDKIHWLDIKWLCHIHHFQEHSRLRQQ